MADVVVLGAGLAATATALHLARGGAEVRVVGAPRRGDLGHVELGVVEHPHRTVASLGEDRARELFAWTTRGKQELAAEGLFERCGMPWASVDAREPGDVHRSAEALQRLGIAAEVRPGEHGFGETLWLPGDGRLVEGALDTLRARAEDAGVVFASDGEAEVVVVTEGESFGGRLVPVREQALRIRGRAPPIGRAGQGWTLWRSRSDGTVEVAGARWATPHLEVGEADDTVVVGAIQDKLEGFARRFLEADGPVLDRWAWTFAQTPDGLPLIGPLPGDARRVVCAGFGGSPAALAMAGARAVADGLLHGRGEVPWFLASRRMVRWRAG